MERRPNLELLPIETNSSHGAAWGGDVSEKEQPPSPCWGPKSSKSHQGSTAGTQWLCSTSPWCSQGKVLLHPQQPHQPQDPPIRVGSTRPGLGRASSGCSEPGRSATMSPLMAVAQMETNGPVVVRAGWQRGE